MTHDIQKDEYAYFDNEKPAVLDSNEVSVLLMLYPVAGYVRLPAEAKKLLPYGIALSAVNQSP